MLDQVIVPHAFAPGAFDQQADSLKLVVTREDHRIDLYLTTLVVPFFLHLQMEETREEVKEAVALQNLFPEICGAVGPARGIGWIAGAAVASFVEGQEVRRRPGQPCGHQDGFGVDGEMDQGAALEFEDRFPRIAVVLVLPAGILDSLASERILQLEREDGNAVHADRDVHRFFAARREMKLAGKAEPVGGEAGLQFRVQFVSRLKKGDAEGASVAFESVAQGGERAVRVHPLTQVGKNLLAGFVTVQGFEPRPFGGLRLADEVEHGLREDGVFAVESVGGDMLITVLEEVRLDHGFEGALGVARLSGHRPIP